MRSTEFDQFAIVWAAAWEQAGSCITPSAIELTFEALHDYSLGDIRKALTVHMRDPRAGRFAPKAADVIGILDAANPAGLPTADEAWSICLRSFDDSDTVIVCDEIMSARAVAQPVMDEGDSTGARMAFRAAYERIIAESRISGRKPRWWISAGMDRELRDQRISEAIAIGRLGAEFAPALPAPSCPRQSGGLVQIGRAGAGPRYETTEDREQKRLQAEDRRRLVVERAETAMKQRELANGTDG